MDLSEFEIPVPKKKKYIVLHIEEEVALLFKDFAKRNGITQSYALRWLYDKAKECYESKKQGGE